MEKKQGGLLQGHLVLLAFYTLGGLEGRARYRLRGKGTLGGRTSVSVHVWPNKECV